MFYRGIKNKTIILSTEKPQKNNLDPTKILEHN